MIKDFISCTGCKKGPCTVHETAVRPVLTDYYRSYSPTSDWWKYFDFVRDYQCMDVINAREDIFQCDHCGFLLEEHLLHIVQGDNDYDLRYCPDCYHQLLGDIDD